VIPVPDEVTRASPEAKLGRYVRVARLGAGGAAEVWKAWDPDRGWVALKVLKPEVDVERLRREAAIAATLSHENIAALHEIGEADGRHYIAMQFVDGWTLAAMPRDDRRLVVRLVRDAARALHFAHVKGIVHRDVKPENLMAQGERVLVMDFGLARPAEAPPGPSSGVLVVGTPAYISPEQSRGETADGRSDVWSLGATLYELATGRLPFTGRDTYDVLRAVQEREPAPPGVDAPLDAILLTCLAKDPARRYATAEALADDLTRWLEGRPVVARRPVLRPRAPLLVLAAAVAVLGLLLAVERLHRSDATLAEAEALLESARAVRRTRDYRPQDAVSAARRAADEFRKLPESAGSLLGLGRAHVLAGDPAAALEAFERADAHDEIARLRLREHERRRHTHGLPPLEDASVIQPPALRAFAAGDYETAARELRPDPRDGDGHRWLADALFHLGRHAEADRRIAVALECDTADVAALSLRGHVLVAAGRPDAALADFNEALRLRKSPEAFVDRAVARLALKDRDESAADLRRALALAPADWPHRAEVERRLAELLR